MSLTNYGKLIKLALSAGVLSDYVAKKLNKIPEVKEDIKGLVTKPGAFKEKFLKMTPGTARDQFIYDAAIAQGKPSKFVPVEVPLPSGGRIVYEVMPDYLMIDGVRVPISSGMAQKLSDVWGFYLPTTKMVKQTYQNASLKLPARPMSSGANIGGKQYSAEEVVSHKIGDSDTSVAFNDRINEDINKALYDKKDPTLIAGQMKDIIMPNDDNANKMGIFGWYDKDGKPIQNTYSSPHSNSHQEYASSIRLSPNRAKIITPDGKEIETTLDAVLNDPNLYKAISDKPGVKRYKL